MHTVVMHTVMITVVRHTIVMITVVIEHYISDTITNIHVDTPV